MQTRSRILDDIARLTNGAAGVASGLRDEVEALVQQRLEKVLANLDLVRREEFEAVEALAIRAREEQEALEKRVAEMEKKLGAAALKKPAPRRASKPKTDES
jgi:BMFP domain-containing protein YqiC